MAWASALGFKKAWALVAREPQELPLKKKQEGYTPDPCPKARL